MQCSPDPMNAEQSLVSAGGSRACWGRVTRYLPLQTGPQPPPRLLSGDISAANGFVFFLPAVAVSGPVCSGLISMSDKPALPPSSSDLLCEAHAPCCAGQLAGAAVNTRAKPRASRFLVQGGSGKTVSAISFVSHYQFLFL